MTIHSFCEMISDVRDEKNQIYDANEIVFIALVSVLCGADSWKEIETFGKTHVQYFKDRLPGLSSIPSSDTFRLFFSVLDISWFEECFRLWVDNICRKIPGVIAIDGKAVCNNPHAGSNTDSGMRSKLYMVSAWAVSNGICLSQKKVNEKSNEITAIPELIKALDIENCIITIDAMGCQKPITKLIIENKADYVLCVKDNHEALKELIKFNLSADMRMYLGKGKRCFEENQGHGRTEYRECVCVGAENLQGFLKGWTGIKSLAIINSVRQVKNKEATMETRYYISSLEPDPVIILKSVRAHWAVENQLHWVLDVGFREDDGRKTGNAAINFSAISKLALMLLKQSDIKLGMAGKRKACGWDEKIRDKVMGIKMEDKIKENGM